MPRDRGLPWRRGRPRAQQRHGDRPRRRPAHGLRARLRLRPGHVAARRAGVRGRPTGWCCSTTSGPAAPTSRRTTRRATAASTATPRTSSRSSRRSTLPPVVFVGHSVSAMIGVLAAAERPGAVRPARARRPEPAVRRRRRLPRRLHAGGDRRAARHDGRQLPRLVAAHRAGDHGRARPARAGRGAGVELLPQRPGHRPALRAHDVPVGQPRRPRPGARRRRWWCSRARTSSRRPRSGGTSPSALPRSELVVLDATGHCPNLSAPDQVVAAMRRWLDAA